MAAQMSILWITSQFETYNKSDALPQPMPAWAVGVIL